MGSVRTILASLFTALGGFFLLALTLGVGFALYLATAPDGVSAPADADAVADRPLLRAQLSQSPNVIREAGMSLPRSVGAPDAATRRVALVRQLQSALARAECYNGPISGIWSEASKDAMRGFVKTVNAELPVEAPDAALAALLDSNASAICRPERAIETGALGSALQASAAEANAALQRSKMPSHDNTEDDRHSGTAPTLLGRAWAPAGMLTPAAITASEDKPAPSNAPRSATPEVTASNDVSPTEGTSVPASTVHFEGNSPLPAAQSIDSQPSEADLQSERRKTASVKTKKTKTARRRPAKYEDVETTISKGFNSLQQSLSSMF
ncbi:MAG: hypothetical protein JSR78_14980 [Proteobacteria bacterium]|nr:hypothetical protein [Pseudomonadota bacterium]